MQTKRLTALLHRSAHVLHTNQYSVKYSWENHYNKYWKVTPAKNCIMESTIWECFDGRTGKHRSPYWKSKRTLLEIMVYIWLKKITLHKIASVYCIKCPIIQGSFSDISVCHHEHIKLGDAGTARYRRMSSSSNTETAH